MEDKFAWLVLSQIPGVGNATFWSLVHRFENPAQVLSSSSNMLQTAVKLGKNQVKGLAQKDEVERVCRRQLRRLEETGCGWLTFADEAYPELLKEITDPPPVLYFRGDKRLLQTSCVAMVGSRASSSYGNRTAFTLARNLAGSGITVVSGLALGIDAEAHRGALAANGKTIGVLGCGIDVVYPRQHTKLFKEIGECGVIISEYPPGTRPEGFRFPARNRIIAGLSKGVVVVEAARKSGSLITAQMALDYGREVYGIPGQVDSFKSEGVHGLLQQGAKLVQSEYDILEDIGAGEYSHAKMTSSVDSDAQPLPSKEARELLAVIEAYPLTREEVLHKSGMDIGQFSECLLLLELDGFIEILPGDKVRKLEAG